MLKRTTNKIQLICNGWDLDIKKLTIKVRFLSIMEQVMGIEPTLAAWKAEVLPLNYTCN